MPDIDEKSAHPLSMSDAEKAELNKLVDEESSEIDAAADDPAADADPEPESAGSDPDKPDKPATNAAAETGKDEAGVVPRQQFDGVLGELRETRSEVKALKARLSAKPEALPERDFDAEDKALEQELAALDERYDEGVDLTDAEYRAAQREIFGKQRAIDRDRAKYEARAELEVQQAAAAEQAEKEQQAAAQAQWDTDVGGWKESLGDWIKDPVNVLVVEDAMNKFNARPELAGLGNAEYLEKLNAYLAKTTQDFPEAAAGEGMARVNQRQVQAAQAAAAVTAAPPQIRGGVGNRGTTTADVDLEHMPHAKPGGQASFSTLSKEKQNELLGIPG